MYVCTQTHSWFLILQKEIFWLSFYHPILKEVSPEYSLEGLMQKLKLQYFGHLMWRTDSLEKTLMLGKDWRQEEKGQQRMRWLDGITKSMYMSFEQVLELGNGQRSGTLQSMGHKSDMTEWLNWNLVKCYLLPSPSIKLPMYLKRYSFAYNHKVLGFSRAPLFLWLCSAVTLMYCLQQCCGA